MEAQHFENPATLLKINSYLAEIGNALQVVQAAIGQPVGPDFMDKKYTEKGRRICE